MSKIFDIKYIFFGLVLLAFFIISSVALVSFYEARILRALKVATADVDLNWLEISIDGTNVNLGGISPNEAIRFKAFTIISSMINSSMIIDNIDVQQDNTLPVLDYTLELLRDDNEITLVGFIPKEIEINSVISDLEGISDSVFIKNLSEVIDYPIVSGWSETLNYAIDSLNFLPNSKITLQDNKIKITALSDSSEQVEKIKKKLISLDPGFFELALNIESPRPLIQPFLFQIIRDEGQINLVNCSARDEYSRALILGALLRFGLEETVDCKIGIGAPSDEWAQAVILTLDHIKTFKNLSLIFKNREIFIKILDSVENVDSQKFIEDLRAALPNEFLVEVSYQPETDDKLLSFQATKNLEGSMYLKGYLPNASIKTAVVGYAKSLFGSENTKDMISLMDMPPINWSIQALVGLEVMGLLEHGSLAINPQKLEIRGSSIEPNIKNLALDILSNKLGERVIYEVDVKYDANLAPKLEGVDPEKCVADINNAIKTFGIEFAPGEIVLQAASDMTLEKMAEIMKTCYVVPMEIGGHTDSQGRKSLNLSISQARAEAVMDALLSYEILTGNLTAKGYGESTPIADNKSVEGRSKNRRIEFTLINTDN